jgi:cytochrome c oxidase cbb3-type subunit 3
MTINSTPGHSCRNHQTQSPPTRIFPVLKSPEKPREKLFRNRSKSPNYSLASALVLIDGKNTPFLASRPLGKNSLFPRNFSLVRYAENARSIPAQSGPKNSPRKTMTLRKLLAIGAISSIAAALAFADDPKSPPKYDPASVERGKQNFASTCGFCHGATAKGGEKGPDLLRSVLVLDDDNGKSIAPVILKGRPERGMPHFPLTPEQITDIANFLHSSIEVAKDRGSYQILNIVTGNPQAGETYFNGAGKCSSCHSVSGDLQKIGAKYDAITLQTKMLQPDYAWTEGNPPKQVIAYSVTITLPSGQSFTGTPIRADDFTISLREADGTYRSFKRTNNTPQVQFNNRLQAHLDQLLHYTDTDIHNLTAYLVTLK